MEKKDVSAMTREELVATITEQQSLIDRYAHSFDQLAAFHKIATNAMLVSNSSGVTNADAFYRCVSAAADAVGYVTDPKLNF